MYVDDVNLAGKEQNIDPMWKVLLKEIDLGEPTSFLDHVYFVCTQRECETSKDVVDNDKHMFESRISAGATEKLLRSKRLDANISLHGLMTWKVMQRNAWNDIASWRTEQLNSCTKSQHLCRDDHQFKEELGSVGELSKVCSQIVLKCLYLACIGGPDTLWSVNKLARTVTKWTRACDRRLARLFFFKLYE